MSGRLQIKSDITKTLIESRIEHRNWRDGVQDLHIAFTAAQPGDVVSIVGPSRVGKSRLFEYVENALLPRDLPVGQMPLVRVRVINKSRHSMFSTKDYARELLEKLGNPLYSTKDKSGDAFTQQLLRLQRIPEDILTAAMMEALRSRDTKYLCFDETQEMLQIHGGEKAACAAVNAYKGIAEELGIVLVFIGTYPILRLLELSPHVIGRTHEVHVQRYRTTPEDVQEFVALLRAFSTMLGYSKDEDGLCEWAPFLYQHSLGCVGILNAWLRRAASRAFVTKAPISLDILRKEKLSAPKLDVIRREIVDGEEYMFRGQSTEPNAVSEGAKRIEKRKGRPFQANPKRHPIGGRK